MDTNQTHSDILGMNRIFDDFIKPGKIQKEKEVLKDWKIKIQPLDLKDSTIVHLMGGNTDMPFEATAKIKSARLLSKAIISINGYNVVADGQEDREDELRSALYTNIMKLPPVVVEKMFQFYLEVEDERDKIFKNPDKVAKEIENF